MVAAATANGWTEDGELSLLDTIDHFGMEKVESSHKTLDAAVERAKQLVNDEQDFFGQATVEEQEMRMVTDEDFGGVTVSWEPLNRYHVDETGVIETVRCEIDA